MNSGDILRKLRLARNLSQSDVAKALGIDRTTYVKYEAGGSIRQKLRELAVFYDVSMEELLGLKQISQSNILNEMQTTNELAPDESVHLAKYRMLSTEHKKAIDYQLNYFYELDAKTDEHTEKIFEK